MQDKIAKWLRIGHLVAVVIWTILIIPTLLLWKDSVLWVGLMSVWANIQTHFSAYMGGRAEKRAIDEEE